MTHQDLATRSTSPAAHLPVGMEVMDFRCMDRVLILDHATECASDGLDLAAALRQAQCVRLWGLMQQHYSTEDGSDGRWLLTSTGWWRMDEAATHSAKGVWA